MLYVWNSDGDSDDNSCLSAHSTTTQLIKVTHEQDEERNKYKWKILKWYTKKGRNGRENEVNINSSFY